MFLDFLLFAVSMVFTQIYCSFAIATPLICIRVGIPITKLLQKNNLIHDTNGLMKQYNLTKIKNILYDYKRDISNKLELFQIF